MKEVAGARRALLLGGGDGRFLAALVSADGDVQADYVDGSARMLELARARAGAERVTYLQQELLTVPLAPAEYDLIVTHFVFDFFELDGARLLAAHAAAAARPGAHWLVSEFRRTWWSGPILWVLYLFFRVTARLETRHLVDHRPLLADEGFRLEQENISRFGLLASELWVKG